MKIRMQIDGDDMRGYEAVVWIDSDEWTERHMFGSALHAAGYCADRIDEYLTSEPVQKGGGK